MRPYWMDEVVTKLEKSFYENLKNTNIAKDVIDKYPNELSEELAETLAEGMIKSRCGDVARELCKSDEHLQHYDVLCKEAFKKASIRLLNEVKK